MYQSKHLKLVLPAGEQGYVTVGAGRRICCGSGPLLVVLRGCRKFPRGFAALKDLAKGGHFRSPSGLFTPCDIHPVRDILDAGRSDNPGLTITNVIRSRFAFRDTSPQHRILEDPDGNHIYVREDYLDAAFMLVGGVREVCLSSDGSLIRLYCPTGGAVAAIATERTPE